MTCITESPRSRKSSDPALAWSLGVQASAELTAAIDVELRSVVNWRNWKSGEGEEEGLGL